MGFTFDTGALIGLERARHAMRKVYVTAVMNGVPITVPVVVAEWWRAGTKEKERARIRRSVLVEPLTDVTARLSGVALTLVRSAHTVDAIVMVVGRDEASRGDLHLGSEGPRRTAGRGSPVRASAADGQP